MKEELIQDGLRIAGRRNQEHERGFTLLEVAIAFTLMMVVGLAATALFLYANNYNSGAGERALSIAVAKQQLEQVRSASSTDALLTIPSGSTSTTATTTVSNGGKSYSVTRTVELLAACTGCNAAKRITITVTPQDKTPLWGASPVTVVTMRSDMTPGPYIK